MYYFLVFTFCGFSPFVSRVLSQLLLQRKHKGETQKPFIVPKIRKGEIHIRSRRITLTTICH